MFGHNINANIKLIADQIEEARGRNLELYQHRVLIDGLGAFDHLLYIKAPADSRADLSQFVKGKGDILGAKRLPIAPGNALTGDNGQLGAVFVVTIALCQPHDFFVGKGAVEGQRFVHNVGAGLVIGADGIGIPQLIIDVLPFAATQH